jgi:SAM-dependent methyltransferase
MGSSQYDNIVSDYNSIYDDLQSLPCGQLEEANLHAAVAPHIVNKRVLDLGCGSGHYTRRMLEWGAKSVVGVDVSEGMVEDAKSRIADAQRGRLDFIVGDVSNGLDLSNSHGSFVVVVGTWLLNYASNLKEMEGMWRSVVANLKPGGLFVGLTIPPPLGSRHELDRAFRDDWAPFGTDGHVTDNADEGFVVHIRLGMPGAEKSVEFDNYYLQNEVFESSCRNAGMGGGLEWMPLVLPDRLKEKFPVGYWNRLVLNPHFRICQARR